MAAGKRCIYRGVYCHLLNMFKKQANAATCVVVPLICQDNIFKRERCLNTCKDTLMSLLRRTNVIVYLVYGSSYQSFKLEK